MIRALLDGRKTQTRRVLKRHALHKPEPHSITFSDGSLICRWQSGIRHDVPAPYTPGDRLWVREAHAFDSPLVRYYATDDVHELRRKRPSIHMPRWASRLTLTVTDVRVQRLQEISEADAIAEGVCEDPLETPLDAGQEPLRHLFADLWNSLHGPDAWDANPWVCALTFEVHKVNIDRIGAA